MSGSWTLLSGGSTGPTTTAARGPCGAPENFHEMLLGMSWQSQRQALSDWLMPLALEVAMNQRGVAETVMTYFLRSWPDVFTLWGVLSQPDPEERMRARFQGAFRLLTEEEDTTGEETDLEEREERIVVDGMCRAPGDPSFYTGYQPMLFVGFPPPIRMPGGRSTSMG